MLHPSSGGLRVAGVWFWAGGAGKEANVIDNDVGGIGNGSRETPRVSSLFLEPFLGGSGNSG